ncbi:hypothetical protein AMR72_15130 [Flavobacterium psychrophilum]|nr:hypothetical protein AMR72_15130 [Flavobacterium psychrophilum]AOE53732.1 hypothetical protein ALW18_15120 [Flavobacterium psychrophilum]
MIWQRKYNFTGTSSGGWVWYKAHFTDLWEASNGDLIGLVSDFGNFLIVRLDSQGNVIWKKKYYDKTNTPIVWTGLSTTARLFTLNSTTLLLKIEEVQSQNGGVKRINHVFYTINPSNGAVIATKQIQSENPILIIRDYEVRSQELFMFGYYDGKAAIIKINTSLTITQSVGLTYSGSLAGYNYVHIYAASPLYNGNYAVLGSFYHYNPNASAARTEISALAKDDGLDFIVNDRDDSNPWTTVETMIDPGAKETSKSISAAAAADQYTRFFLSEVSADNKNVISAKITDRNFTATYQTMHRNSDGLALSISTELYKLNSGLTASSWTKRVWVQELNRALLVNKSLGNTFDAYSDQTTSGKFATASAVLDYATCRTENVAASLTLANTQFTINAITIALIAYTPKQYTDPTFTLVSMTQTADTKLCSAPQPQPDLSKSTIVASPVSIQANGTSTSVITVTLKDAQGNVINPSTYTVTINTNAGTWSGNVVSSGNGVYTRTLKSSTSQQTATLSFSVTGIGTSPNTASVQFIGVPNLSLSTIIANPVSIQANGTATSVITVTLKDAQGNVINPSNTYTVTINTNAGTWTGNVISNGNGVYTRTLKSSTAQQTATLTFTVTGIGTSPNTASVQFIGVPNLSLSTIIATPVSIQADGSSTSLITVTLKDAQGNIINPSNYGVQINTTAGSWATGVSTSGNGIYNRTLKSSTTPANATVSFLVTGIGTSPNTANVEFTRPGLVIKLSDITSFQSPYLYLQAAGSDGYDSTKGRHLRWALKGYLGERHLPKGDYASNYVNFNKEHDYVRVYKAPYTRNVFRLDFFAETPEVVDNANRLWIYRFSDKEFYVRFGNASKYDQVKQSIDPFSDPSQFMASYGAELIEVENIKDLFFNVEYQLTGVSGSSQLRSETLSVDANILLTNKYVTNRKTVSGTQLNNPVAFLMENGRATRWRISNAQVAALDFEFYTETIRKVNDTTGWEDLGEYALTKDQQIAYKRLEPSDGDVNGVWHRFDAEAYVKVRNYQEKWDAVPEPGDRNIAAVVDKYISLSDDINNPFAEEEIPLENNPSDPSDYLQISNLDMLNFSGNDYHIARMLGLGTLDLEGDGAIRWLYVAEYFTRADLHDGEGTREVQHLYMSLPTSNADFRLPQPVDLDHITPGVFIDGENGEAAALSDADGYSYDGMSRYLSIYTKELQEESYDIPFFISNEELNSSIRTIPVYGGLKYKLDNGGWRKPELSNDNRYYNLVPSGPEFFETRYILIPEPQDAYFVHRQTTSGQHTYKPYGINWFSRAKVSDTEMSIVTAIRQKNPLLPPSNTNALLIRQESPLLLTSQYEQNRLNGITGDKTLIRLTYDYHSFQELKNYNIPLDSPYSNADLINPAYANDPLVLFPDNQEIFADEVDIFFRNHIPNSIQGKALSVTNDSADVTLSVITTGSYTVVSTGETLIPTITAGTEANYIGGIFICADQQYIIYSVAQGASGPTFKVYKKQVSDSIVSDELPSGDPAAELLAPVLAPDGIFMAIENMQNSGSWGTPNPLAFKVKVGNPAWTIKREIIERVDDGQVQRMVEKTRGFWGAAQVTADPAGIQQGTYKISFNNLTLPQHAQYNSGAANSVEWYQGIVRIYTQSAGTGTVHNQTRKILPVIKIENIGTSSNVILYVQDPEYDPAQSGYDYIQTGSNILVNFYPGYKIYLYKNSTYHIDEPSILPSAGEGLRYSIFGFRSRDLNGGCDPSTGACLSKISTPCMMYAQELVEALTPEKPEGALYATRPDFFGRSTYTLTTKYQHKPHGVLFYRSNDQALLDALYERQTIKEIREQLAGLGGNNEEYLTNRWDNFLNFSQLASEGDFKLYPPADVSPDGYKFPNPDKQAFFDWANKILEDLGQPLITEQPGTLKVGSPKIINFVKGAIYNAFVALTEMPVIYQYINGGTYQPLDLPQVIKDRNGSILSPGSDGFSMAPMMKVSGTSPHQTLFTDFKLDGTSNNLYFYGVKELSTQMKMSDFSPFLGPIKLVNTNAPETPEITRVTPILGNNLDTTPKIQLEINAFSPAQNIRRVAIYRSTSWLQAQSVLSMQMVKIIDLEESGILYDRVWTVFDDFPDLTEVPYGDGLFYRITVAREVRYANSTGETTTEYAPSQPSKVVASLIVEIEPPTAPQLQFQSLAPINGIISSVSLLWTKTTYNAKYHVYKMNGQGNWDEIYLFQTNDENIVLPLEDTDLQDDSLQLVDGNGNPMYHHFKVVSENTAAMQSLEENILTIFDPNSWIEI